MTFFGALSDVHIPNAGQSLYLPSVENLPCIASHELDGLYFSLWGQVPWDFSTGLGVLLDGHIFHANAADLAARLGTDPHDQTTLLLHAYRKWGMDFPQYLEGEYAFALWDSEKQRLLMGRDSTGYRPLFYMQRGGNIRFSREVRTLLALSGSRKQPDENHIAHWLALTLTGTNSTFFKDVCNVPPGHTVLFEKGHVTLNVYWQPENLPLLHLKDSREYAEGLHDVFMTAVKDRVQPGRAAGSQLSGGLDSSSVTALAAGLLLPEGRRIAAFTAVPAHPTSVVSGRFSDEGPHAASMTAMYPNIDHVLVRHGNHSVFSVIDRFNAAQMEPVFSPSNYDWVYEICLQARRRGVETLLIGAMGNFTISYNGSLALPALMRQGRLLNWAQLARDLMRSGFMRWRGVANQLLRPCLPAWARTSIDRLLGRYNSIYDYSLIRREFAQSRGLNSMTIDNPAQSLDSRLFRLFYMRRPDYGSSTEAFRQLSGVSMSDPTMDRRVVEYCLSVPVEYFCEKGVPRSLIRNAMKGILPEQVRTERRKGLQAADFREHFRAERQEALDEVERMKKVDLATRALDLPQIESMMQWSDAQIVAYGEPGYWAKLLRALSLGRFLRRLEDGTLFSG